MSDAPLLPCLSSAEARRIDQICDRFEAAWKAGPRPMLEEYLSAAGEPERSVLLRQLLLLDWDFRRRAGDRPAGGDYLARFPGEQALIDAVGREMSVHADDTPWPSGLEGMLPEAAVSGSARYELLQEVGHGGAGVVFRGRDRLLGRELAVKVLRDVYRRAPEFYRRFVEEARVGSRLQHPAIVPVYELGWFDDRRPYFTMKLVEGQTLGALLKERADPSQDWPRLLGVFEQVCQAMAYAHAQGVVHRDLKPTNIMVGAFGEVQVMDWGFAKVLGGQGEPRESPSAAPADGETASQSGVMMGTPAYMPPEQARGEADRIDSRADVFALGAILCEILTGEPPYVGAFPDVCLMAAQGELADAHKRLDVCGADAPLRELARRCLAPDRDARPVDAGGVARDVAAYLASAQEQVRKAQLERAAAEARAQEARAKAKAERRARRLTLALAAAAVLLLASAAVGLWWYDRVRQARALQTAGMDSRVEAALAEADDDVNRNDWSGAAAAATRAQELLQSGGSDRWKRRVHELRTDLSMVRQVEEARRVWIEYDPFNQTFPAEEALTRYAEAFGQCGVRVGADPAEAAARATLRPAAIRDVLAAGLEDWWMIARGRDAAAHDWLGTVLQSVDADPWRVRLRGAVEQGDRRGLEELAATDDAARQPPATVAALARALMNAHAYDSAVALLQPARMRFPDDFWIELELGEALAQCRPPDYSGALRFQSIAGALRPGSVTAYDVNLAYLLIHNKDWDGAIFAARKALEVQPDCAEAYNKLGIGLEHKGDWERAQAAYRKSLELKPNVADDHYNLGLSLAYHGPVDEAAAELERAVQLKADYTEAWLELGRTRCRRKDYDGALAAEDKVIQLDAGCAAAHCFRGAALLRKGRAADAVAAFEKAIRLDPTMDNAYDGLGTACFNLGQFERAVAAQSRAVDLSPRSARDQYDLAGGLEATGDLAGAIAAYREAIRLDPGLAEAHCNLHFLLQNQGLFAEALAEIKEGHRLGSARPDWDYHSDQWLKQTQRLVDLDGKLPAILDGRGKPADAAEALEYAYVCRLKALYGASARLYADAFMTWPAPPGSPEAGRRYDAACAAAQAGAGQGRDAADLDAEGRARWRKQALDWLRAELALLAEAPNDHSRAASVLRRWRGEKALAGIREPEELAKLPESERGDCIRFWADVEDLLTRRLSETQRE